MKMEFRKPNEEFSSEPNAVGSPVIPTFQRKDNKDGSCVLVETGTRNWQEEIDSYKESTDYTTLLERMERGDPVAEARALQAITANMREPFDFVDDSSAPDLRQISDAMIEARRIYDDLGLSAKGLAFEDFLSTCEVKYAKKPTSSPEVQKEEVKSDETK